MARPRQRVGLEDGLKLDLNKLVREGFWPHRNDPLIVSTRWISNLRGVMGNARITVTRFPWVTKVKSKLLRPIVSSSLRSQHSPSAPSHPRMRLRNFRCCDPRPTPKHCRAYRAGQMDWEGMSRRELSACCPTDCRSYYNWHCRSQSRRPTGQGRHRIRNLLCLVLPVASIS